MIEPVETICIKEVQKLFKPELSLSTAQRRIQLCRDALGKEKHQILSMKEFCKYFGLL